MFNFVIFVVNKEKVGQKNFSPSSFVAVVGSEIRYPGWIKIGIQDKHPGSVTLVVNSTFVSSCV
jgi:hypothetical protein